MVQDRRQYQRLIPNSPLLVCLGESKSGFLFDLCEGGLAVDGLAPESRNEVISLALDLPEDNGHIQARAEIAWTSDSGPRTGLRFVDLADTSRQRLREWVSARAVTARLAATEKGPAQPVFVTHATDALVSPISQEKRDEGVAKLRSALVPLQLTRESNSKKPEVRGHEGLSRYGKSRHLIGLFLAGVLLSSVFVSLGYYLGSSGQFKSGSENPRWRGGIGDNPQARAITAAVKVPESPPKGLIASANPPPATTLSLPPTISLDLSGLVLQVGAMTHEDNADVLAQDLHQRNFPAFVFKRGTDRFYRVAVGPYSDADSTVRAREELERQGFKAILRRWSPE